MFSIVFVLILLVIAILLFATELLAFEVVGLLLVSALLVVGILKPEDAYHGFGSDTIITIGGLFVLSAALLKTGLMERVSKFIQRHAGDNPYHLAVVIMISVALASSFISNTAATAFFLPAVISLSRRAKVSSSKLLMPLAFASILTSSVTLISTSANIVISGLLTQYKLPAMGMFELAPVGIPIAIAGLIYMFTIGIKLLPSQKGESLQDAYNLRDYLSELIVLPESKLAGKNLKESRIENEMNLIVVGIVRDGKRIVNPSAHDVIEAGDTLLVEGSAEEIVKIKDTAGLEIRPDLHLSDDLFRSNQVSLIEAMVMPGSKLRGSTLKQIRFRERFGLTVLALNRHGITLRTKLSQIPLRIGDVLLIQGTKDRIHDLLLESDLNILGELSDTIPRSPKARYAVLIFALTIALGTFKIMPFAVAVILGTSMLFLTKTITPQEAYNAIEWRILVLIGCMIAFGSAMEQSGTAAFLSRNMVNMLGGFGPQVTLGGFFILTVLLTQPMSNQAAALVLLPVAIQTANQLGLNPRTFAMMIAVAASCSYLTPLEPSCVLVYGPGRYKFRDFLKVGALLTLVIFILSMFLVPIFWPLK